MKYIITTVGTSAIEKSKISIENFKNKDYDYFDTFKEDLTKKKKELLNYFSKFDITKNEHLKQLSAEIKSLIKRGCDKDTFNYLIVTDTAECRLCSEFLKDYLEDKFKSQSKLVKIKGLCIDNLDTFQKEGMVNLVDELDKINNSHYGNKILLNITGGYKATIPYLTILGQTWHIPLYYIFEEEENLIEIPKIPIEIDRDFFEKYSKELSLIENGIDNYNEFKKNFKFNDLNKIESIIYECGNMAELSSIGKILWAKYKSTYINFYVTKDVKEKVDKNDSLREFIKNFANPQIRSQHIDSPQGINIKPYKIFKKTGRGENIWRIVFKEENNKIFISHIFLGSEVKGGEDYIMRLERCDWSNIRFNEIVKIEKCEISGVAG